MSDDLVSWLRQQLDDDDRAASAWPLDQQHWCAGGERYIALDDGSAEHGSSVDVTGLGFPVGGWERIRVKDDRGSRLAAHIARHDPARILREIEAKRRIIDEAFDHAAKIDGEWGCCCDAAQIEAGECPETPPAELPILRLLALPYADRPGYREEWKP